MKRTRTQPLTRQQLQYSLKWTAQLLSALHADILDVLEGPVAITECSQSDSQCELESLCQVGGAWQKISKAIRVALDEITLADLTRPARDVPFAGLTRGITRTLVRHDRG